MCNVFEKQFNKMNKQRECEMSNTTNRLNLAVIGPVGSGKSTTIGHLLLKCGGISEHQMNICTKESEKMQKASLKYAWILDKLKEERKSGHTIDITFGKLETAQRFFTIIDTPGQRNYLDNMISGTSIADCALFIISAEAGQFEDGMSEDGQIREQITLSFHFGVKQLIFGINKMDSYEPAYSETRFVQIQEELLYFIQKGGYDFGAVEFVPISGWVGENLCSMSEEMPWFDGKCLLDTLDGLGTPARSTNSSPLRILLLNVHKMGEEGTLAIGYIANGVLEPGMDLSFAPTGLNAEVNSVESHREVVSSAGLGNIVGFNMKDLPANVLRRGFIAGDTYNCPPRCVEYFVAEVTVLNHPSQIAVGHVIMLLYYTTRFGCTVADVTRRSGERLFAITSGDVANVKLVPRKPTALESVKDLPMLGRFVIRDFSRIVALGVIKSVTFTDDFNVDCEEVLRTLM